MPWAQVQLLRKCGNGGDTDGAIETMFRQRSARFQGASASATASCMRRADRVLYRDSRGKRGSGVDVRLHVLRLNGDIVAVRYNIGAR